MQECAKSGSCALQFGVASPGFGGQEHGLPPGSWQKVLVPQLCYKMFVRWTSLIIEPAIDSSLAHKLARTYLFFLFSYCLAPVMGIKVILGSKNSCS